MIKITWYRDGKSFGSSNREVMTVGMYKKEEMGDAPAPERGHGTEETQV